MLLCLKQATGTFRRPGDVIRGGINWNFTLVYLDDKIIYSSNLRIHTDCYEKYYTCSIALEWRPVYPITISL